MSNILSYGIALPHYRIEDTILFPVSAKKGAMRAVCYSDEDIITLAFDATKNCFENLLSKSSHIASNIDGIFFATSTPVFHHRYHASFLGDLLNLPQGILALDFTNSFRSGTDAIILANNLIDSGKYKNILVVAVDVDYPEIGKEQSSAFGHAACAMLMSNEKGLADLVFSKSCSSSFAEEFSYKMNTIQHDPRYSREVGFKNNLTNSLKSIVSDPPLFDSIILNSTYARLASGVFLKAGFKETQFSKDSLTSKIGNTGAAHALLLLIYELENGKTTILLADYDNGTNIFEIKNNTVLKRKILQEHLNNYDLVNTYQDYLLLRKAGNFKSLKYKRKEMFSSEMMQERDKETLLYLKGLKCEKCGTIYYLKSARCKKCKCEKFVSVQLKNTGTVYAFTSEHYFPTSFSPITMTVIDLDGGARMTVQQTDTMFAEKNKIEIGAKVKLVLRKMIENDAKPNYFWKAKRDE